jgi:hypothetical protein
MPRAAFKQCDAERIIKAFAKQGFRAEVVWRNGELIGRPVVDGARPATDDDAIDAEIQALLDGED